MGSGKAALLTATNHGKRAHGSMRRIDQHEHGSASGGGLYAPTSQVVADDAPACAAQPERRFADIVIRRMTHLRGPNIWTYRAVIEAIVDIGELEDYPSNAQPGFYDRLTAWLPAKSPRTWASPCPPFTAGCRRTPAARLSFSKTRVIEIGFPGLVEVRFYGILGSRNSFSKRSSRFRPCSRVLRRSCPSWVLRLDRPGVQEVAGGLQMDKKTPQTVVDLGCSLG